MFSPQSAVRMASADKSSSQSPHQRKLSHDANFAAKMPASPQRVDLAGRLFEPARQLEAPCRIYELSPDGASLECEMALAADFAVVVYVGGFSRFEGRVESCDANNIEIKFVCSAAKRQRMAEQIAAILDKGIDDSSILRRHERTSRKGHIQFTRADGQIVPCEVIDISVSGVSLKTNARPLVGEFVLIAGIAGRISRYHEDGIGIEFLGKEV